MTAGIPSRRRSLQEVLNSTTDGVISLDADWNCTYVNPAGAELLGTTPEALIGSNVWEEFPEAIGTRFEQRYRRALATQEPVFLEERFERLGRWYAIRAFPSEDGMTVFYHDVTEREHARAALAERSRQQAALAELSTRCLSEQSLQQSLADAARTVATTLAASRVEILGRGRPEGPLEVVASAGPDVPDGRLGAPDDPLGASDDHRHAAPIRVAVPGGPDGAAELLIHGPGSLESELNTRDFLTAVVALVSNCVRRHEMLLEVEYLAQHEPATGLPNRRLLLGHLERVLDTADPTAAPPAVLTVAIDRLWLIANSYGHAAADQLVVAVADRIRRVFEPQAMLAQLSTDLFVLVMHQPDTELTAERMAERLHTAMREPVRLASGEHYVTLTVGITHASAGSTPEALLRDADTALRHAKPPSRTAVFDQRAHDEAVRRAVLDRELHLAVERSELDLHYQPIVLAGDGAPVGIEALVRWAHPSEGLLLPGAFIPAAEENGLIVPIGHWVLAEACVQAARLQRELELPLAVSVNVSARQLSDPGLVDRVEHALAASGLQPGTLELEITETALLEESEAAGRLLAEFKRLGVRIALDDFGSGYSSLSYLRELPVDTLKVDRSFVVDLVRRADTAIVDAIVKMAHAMEMEVVAEGVEDRQQADLLARLGCDRLQGYLFQRPVPLDQLRRYLEG